MKSNSDAGVYNTPSNNYAKPPGVVPSLGLHDPVVAKLDMLLRKALAVRTQSIPFRSNQTCEVTTDSCRAT